MGVCPDNARTDEPEFRESPPKNPGNFRKVQNDWKKVGKYWNMENAETEEILKPDVVLTRKTGLAAILATIARKAEKFDELYLRYIPIKGKIHEGEHNPEEVCNTVLKLLVNLGWFEDSQERKLVLQEFEGPDRSGAITKYKAHVMVITIQKHGALIRK